VLDSEKAARAVLIALEPGELGEHEVQEHAFVLVVEGTAKVEAGGESLEAGEGTLLVFEPKERRTLSSREGARLLLVLAPWPAPGHYRGGGDERLAASGS
jgi:quercetin dioxygenase-like cupin family protein